jgi:hypothetical protein
MFRVPPWPQTVYNMVPVMIAALQGAVGSDGAQEGETWGCKRGWQADHRLMRVMEAAWQRSRNNIHKLKVRDQKTHKPLFYLRQSFPDVAIRPTVATCYVLLPCSVDRAVWQPCRAGRRLRLCRSTGLGTDLANGQDTISSRSRGETAVTRFDVYVMRRPADDRVYA